MNCERWKGEQMDSERRNDGQKKWKQRDWKQKNWKQKIKRRIKSKVYLALVLVLLLFYAGCSWEKEGARKNGGTVPGKIAAENGKTGADGEASAKQGGKGQEEKETTKWSVTHRALPHLFETATIQGGKIVGCYYDGLGVGVSVCNAETGEELQNFQIRERMEISSVSASGEEILLLGNQEDQVCLWEIKADGDVKKRDSKRDSFKVENLGIFPSVESFFADGNGHYYLWYRMSVPMAEAYGTEELVHNLQTWLDRVYVLDSDKNCICYEQIPDSNGNKLLCVLFDEEDRPYMLARDEDGIYVRRMRTEERAPYEKNRLEGLDVYDLERGKYFDVTQEGLTFLKGGALHLFRLEFTEGGSLAGLERAGKDSLAGLEQARDERLLELAQAGIYEEDVIAMSASGEGVELIDNRAGADRSEYTRITKGEESERVRVTLAVMELSQQMKKAIADFNRNQSEITIEPVIYVKDHDFDAGYQRLQLDLIQGKAPDLIDTAGIDVDVLAGAGSFADLYPFLDGDQELGRDALALSVLKAYETAGKLHVLAPNFYLYSTWGAKSVVQGRSGVSMEELMEILRENGGDVNSIYGFSADESVLRTLCTSEMDEFIDWDEAFCDFENERFWQVLRFAKEYKGKGFESLYNALREKDILFVTSMLSGVEDCCLWSGLFGEPIEFIGCPTASGSGTVAYLGGGIAMNEKAKHPAECWKFIREYVRNGYDEGLGFPLLLDRLEEVLLDSMQEKMVLGEEGKAVKQVRRSYQERDNRQARIYVYKASKNDVEAVRRLIESVSGKYVYHNEIMNIIEEEAESYFQNAKDERQVAAIIQNRVQLYLKENQ